MTEAAKSALPLASFRDPGGRIVSLDKRVLRMATPSGRANLSAMLNSSALVRFAGNGNLVRTRILEESEWRQVSGHPALPAAVCGEADFMVVESERIEFASYPYEWPPEMLYAAAELTLALCEALLAENRGLKDATPYNVLFRGATPVFIDVLSFEDRHPCDPFWRAYAQFWRTFLLPLLVNRYLHLPLEQLFVTRRDGIEPQEVITRACLPPACHCGINPAVATEDRANCVCPPAMARHSRAQPASTARRTSRSDTARPRVSLRPT